MRFSKNQSTSNNSHWWLLIALLIQAGIIYTHFSPFFACSDSAAFNNIYDGSKNYYTLYSYVNDVNETSFTHYRMMNYPYGDAVYYTDNTPAFAVPYKWLSGYFHSLRGHVIPVFNYLVLLNLMIATLLSYLILKKFVRSAIIIIVCSIALVWINPMIFRLSSHLNLSLSAIPLLWIWLLIVVSESKHSTKQSIISYTALLASLIISFFIHPYYSFIGGLMSAFWLLCLAIKTKSVQHLLASFVVPIASIFICRIVLTTTDPDFFLRSSKVIGYGMDEWEVSVFSMVTPYLHNTIRFFFPSDYYPFYYEGKAYLGAGALVFICCFLLGIVKSERRHTLIAGLRKNPSYTVFIAMFFTSLFMIMMSFGEDYYLFKTKHHFYNFLNPIYILRKTFLPELSHLRYTGRFFFPAFFLVYFSIAFMLDTIRKSNRILYSVVTAIFLLLICFDASDSISEMNVVDNFLSRKKIANIVPGNLDTKNYDCILPIPYYHVGSEDAIYTIETDESFFDYTMQFSAASGLPIMSSKMSRTPEYQNYALVDIFLNQKLGDSIEKKLSGKKILIIVNTAAQRQYNLSYPYKYEVHRKVLLNGITLPQKLNATEVCVADDLIFYEYRVD